MKKHVLSMVLGFLLVLSVLGGAYAAASGQFTSVTGSHNPSSSGIAQDLASSQYVANALGVEYSSASFTSIVDTALTSSVKQNSQMNIILIGGPKTNSVVKELVNSGASHVNWAASPGQVEVITGAWGGSSAKVFIVAGKNRAATEKACKDFANQIKTGTVLFAGISTTVTPITVVTTTYTISATAGTGGSINPNGTVAVNSGSSQTFTITPNSGYTINDVLVDGISQGAISSYTFTNVNTYHYISASFTQQNVYYTITASPAAIPGGPGYIDPSGSVSVLSGNPQTFNIYANTGLGHQIDQIYVDGSPISGVHGLGSTSYTFPSVSGPHSITATFT